MNHLFENPKDTDNQIQDDMKAYGSLRQMYGQEQRDEVLEAERQEKIQEIKHRLSSLFDLAKELQPKSSPYSINHNGYNIRFEARGHDNRYNEIQIIIGGKQKHCELLITKEHATGEYHVDYYEEGTGWRKNPNATDPRMSNQFKAEDLLTEVPELTEIETILLQAKEYIESQPKTDKATAA